MRRHAVITTALAAVALAGPPPSHSQAEVSDAYRVEVWSQVLFGPDGRVAEYRLIDEDKYPGAFAENVKARVQRAKIDPPQVEGRATTLRTGVRLDFAVTPTAEGGGQVRVAGLAMLPLPTRRYYASYPKDIARTGGWQGEVTGVCKVATDGKCGAIDVQALPGMPESVRRYARASLEGWTFAPQELDGRPIEGEYTMRLRLNTLDNRPDNFRQDKFLRLLQSRQ